MTDCRSIFLQGILISTQDKWPKIKNVNSENYINKLNSLVKEFNFNNKIELCFSYVKSIEWINGLLVGSEDIKQLEENIRLFKIRKLSSEEFKLVRKVFNSVPRQLLNPSLWNTTL